MLYFLLIHHRNPERRKRKFVTAIELQCADHLSADYDCSGIAFRSFLHLLGYVMLGPVHEGALSLDMNALLDYCDTFLFQLLYFI